MRNPEQEALHHLLDRMDAKYPAGWTTTSLDPDERAAYECAVRRWEQGEVVHRGDCDERSVPDVFDLQR